MLLVGCCRGDDEKEYLVKWKELSYDECYWESESDISAFQPEIERFNRIQSRKSKMLSSKQKSILRDAMESKKKQKEFQQYEHSPEFISGGTLFSLLCSFCSLVCFSFPMVVNLIICFLVQLKAHSIHISLKG